MTYVKCVRYYTYSLYDSNYWSIINCPYTCILIFVVIMPGFLHDWYISLAALNVIFPYHCENNYFPFETFCLFVLLSGYLKSMFCLNFAKQIIHETFLDWENLYKKDFDFKRNDDVNTFLKTINFPWILVVWNYSRLTRAHSMQKCDRIWFTFHEMLYDFSKCSKF